MQEAIFQFSRELTSQQYVVIRAELPVYEEVTTIYLPVWRPGRYELGNFSKYVRNIQFFNDREEKIAYEKTTDSTWRVKTEKTKYVSVYYEFYANELNSGSTFIDQTQLYVNPVNCCLFTDDTFQHDIKIELDIPDSWQIATSMKTEGSVMRVKGFDELFDSPFVASSLLQERSYESNGTLFHIWFNGVVKPDWTKILYDFKKFTDKQVEAFGDFPVDEFHFINQIVPFRKYHGVEHLRSTIITLGPTFEIFEELYNDLLGVSSHELYHAWNVKSIRPIEMFPYNFKKENYSPLGYLCEGVTTYQGDMFLRKSEVFDDATFFFEFGDQFQKHFDNPARMSYSVRSSSIDTWVDGYEPGAPGRKVSIYTEGCLLAFLTDVFIMQATNNEKNIDDLMIVLYEEFAKQNKGVSEADYLQIIERVSSRSFEAYFNQYFVEPGNLEEELNKALDYVGCKLVRTAPKSIFESKYGVKYAEPINAAAIKAVYPGSPADRSGLMLEDEIFAVNNIALTKSLDKWISHFQGEKITLLVRRNGIFMEIELREPKEGYYDRFSIAKVENPDQAQTVSFNKWLS